MFCILYYILTFGVELLNLKTAMPIIKLFNAKFYISVCNVKGTLRYCKENTSQCVISVIAIAMLN